MKKGESGRTLSPKMDDVVGDHHKKNYTKKQSNRFLITINVFGSAGPMRFVVSGDESAAGVIETALKIYAKEGRLPVLGSHVNDFFLYPANAGFDALKATEEIGSCGVRNFVLCKKQGKLPRTEARSHLVVDGKASRWRVWLHKSFSLKIQSHPASSDHTPNSNIMKWHEF